MSEDKVVSRAKRAANRGLERWIGRSGWQITLAVVLAYIGQSPVGAKEWTVPLAGNAFRTSPDVGRLMARGMDELTWNDTEDVFSVFVRVDRPSQIQLTIVARSSDAPARMMARVGTSKLEWQVEQKEWTNVLIGSIKAGQAGYLRIDLQATDLAANASVTASDVVVSSDVGDLQLDFVRSNDDNMFYWGRRGPSVHLSYETPENRKWRWAYNEVTVPEGQDPIGSYFMANGFSEGYFGIQVNSADERRVLFSVWSPFSTDDPKQIPEEQRIVLLARGTDVRTGEFGNEGSGGQSFLVYPWKAGRTYRFLTEVQPDGEGHTIYTSWFGDRDANEWRLIASFLRPKTDTHLRGFHSFLESFLPEYGFVERRANYGNVWVCDVDGKWHECVTAKLGADATGSGRHRMDFAGGCEESQFYLKNCGFFAESGVPGTRFTRPSQSALRPNIDLDSLPRK